jgi:hypothetical protein
VMDFNFKSSKQRGDGQAGKTRVGQLDLFE